MQFCHIRLRSEIFWFPTRGYCICKTGRLKKRRDYLDIRIIRLLSLWSRASIYKIYFNSQRVSRSSRSGKSCLSTRKSYDRYRCALTAGFMPAAGASCIFRRYAVHGFVVPVCRRSVLRPYVEPNTNTMIWTGKNLH